MFATRKAIQQHTISSHGDATRFFVTFLDNHDEKARFFCRPAPDPANPGAIHRFDDQLTLGMACLFTLQGIPCIYYGTEQGLHGAGDVDEAVREALWGKPDVFQFDWHADYAAAPVDSDHKFYFELREIARVRRQQPALKYGRQYFRQVSPVDDGSLFQVPQQAGSVLAFSRILQDEEVLVVANTNTEHPWSGDVVVDFSLNPIGAQYQLLYSNCRRYGRGAAAPGRVVERRRGTVTILEDTKPPTTGPIRVVRVTLQSMEVQIMSR
jgi:glycosidase